MPAILGLLVSAATVTVPSLVASANQRLAAPASAEPHTFLRTIAGFSSAELRSLDGGEPLTKVLETDTRQVAVVGAIRVRARRERLLERSRDISNLRQLPIVLQVGAFGQPSGSTWAGPRAEDLRDLAFEDYDLVTIRDCTPGDCGVRLSAASMAQFGKQVDWRAPDWRDQAGSLWRRLFARYASEYLATGTLAQYHNKEVPLSVAKEFGVLFDDSRYFASVAPEFFAYLEQFPRTELAGIENILYWSKENWGPRPVTSITHMSLYTPPPDASPTRRPALVATKRIYATHYFDAGLGLTLAFGDDQSGFYMLSVNRIRTRSLTSVMRTMARSTVQRRSRDALEAVLRSTKAALER